jgi:glycosyltransferase involved in cell wall biosynthesis
MEIFDISIIVPCYNASKYVSETIDSILNQNYDLNRVEVLLINDGSTDDTLNIIKKYESDNVIVIDKKNEGVSKTRNRGIKEARGRYILFLDADDLLSKNSLKNIISFFDNNYSEIDLVTYPIVFFYTNGRKKEHSRYKNQFNKGTGIYDLDTYYDHVQATINVVIKNDKKVLFDTKQFYSEDEQFNTNVLMEKKKIGYVKNARYYYRRHDESVTAKKHKYDVESIYKFHTELQNKYNNHLYIQSIIMNNLRWRVKEDCLYPDNMDKKDINKYLNKLSSRLSIINFEKFNNNEANIDEETLLNILALSKVECSVRNNRLVYRNGIILEKVNSNNNIHKITYNDGKINIFGSLQTPYFYNDNVRLIARIIDNKGHKRFEDLKLSYDYDYEKYFSRKYILTTSCDIKEIKFILKCNNKSYPLETQPVDWCSKRKSYGKYQVRIDKKIKIRKKYFIDTLFNKITFSKNIKFYAVELLSIKEKKYNIYYGDDNSKVYDLYLKDDSNNKIFINNNNGLRYKKLIIRASKVITDKSIKEVLPFGGLRKNYIQISSFAIDEVNK